MVVAVLAAACGMALAQTEPAAEKCQALAGADFSGILDAPTQVLAAKPVAAAGDMPAYCDVQGYIQPQIGIQLRLPANWNGKFLKYGCGGFCGAMFTAACDAPLRKGYACIVSDMGHKSTALDAKWAYNNLQAEVDFAYRATHVNAIAGKAITAAFYGKAPSRAIYMGCSTGGRQGLVEAQRFPYDFDGIVAGAPVIDETGDGMALLWNVVATLGKDGRSILGVDDLRLVNKAAIASCDADDGVKDGLIGDPRSCRFDPAALACKGAKGADCLTREQADAVRKIYGGPVNAKGMKLYPSGALPGSELNWIDNYVAKDGGPSTYYKFMGDLFGYMSFMPDPGPGWKITDFDFEKDSKRIAMMEALYSGSNPDLRKFKANGGKMISYQGWADQSVLPLNVIDYYETATKTMGGRAAIEDFYRLFMVPGMNHCTGGAGAYAIDYLDAIEKWVEQGQAPDRLLSVHPKADGPVRFPVAAADTAFSRPVYPYPAYPRYAGRGDQNDAANYPRTEPRAR